MPLPLPPRVKEGFCVSAPEITLRDYFAGQALAASFVDHMLAARGVGGTANDTCEGADEPR